MERLIIDIVCEHFGTNLESIKIKSRKPEVKEVRHVCYFMLKKHTRNGLANIGALLDQDHATVLNGLKRINNYIETERQTREHIEAIDQKIIVATQINFENIAQY